MGKWTGWVLALGGRGSSAGDPGWKEERGLPVHLVTDVGFAQTEKQIPNITGFLTVRWRLRLCMMVLQHTG